ncbi:methyltransferase family protein, partial [Keratinibaculum paraultunense]
MDVGCGTGNFSIKLAKMGCEVVGIDVSKEMLKVAEEKAK